MSYNPNLDHTAVIRQVRALYPEPQLSANQCVALINEAAKRFIALGETDCGLNKDTTGNHGTGADGKGYSVDILVYRDSAVYFDCLKDAGDSTSTTDPLGMATPVWQGPKPANVATWAPPFASPTGPEPPDPGEPPPVDPQPPDPGEPGVDLGAIALAIMAIQADVNALRGDVTPIREDVHALKTKLVDGQLTVKVKF